MNANFVVKAHDIPTKPCDANWPNICHIAKLDQTNCYLSVAMVFISMYMKQHCCWY